MFQNSQLFTRFDAYRINMSIAGWREVLVMDKLAVSLKWPSVQQMSLKAEVREKDIRIFRYWWLT